MSTADGLRARLERASSRMQALCADLDETLLRAQFDPEFSPIGWHLGHVAWQEELWVLRERFGYPALQLGFDEVFDSFRPDKQARGRRLPSKASLFEYRGQVRARVLSRFEEVMGDSSLELMQGAGMLRFVANHESQHVEIALCQRLAGDLPLSGPLLAALPVQHCVDEPGWLELQGGNFAMGTSTDPERWDNECPEHACAVDPFQLQREPVCNGDWLEFVRAGGYDDERLWSPSGWSWRKQHDVRLPLYWSGRERDDFVERTLSGSSALELRRAICHVSWYEAEAYATFAGARLPTEPEWEWAARHASEVRGMCQGVWEWTASSFHPYPGFRAQSYRGYSEPWFDGDHRVARGGAFLTEPELARRTFRNWYLPHMRRAFLGVRLARNLK